MATPKVLLLPPTGQYKTLCALHILMQPKNLVHFFKCMDSSCSFTSDDDDLFLVHLSAHREQALLCVYCGLVATSGPRLIKHMVTAHGSRKAQCSLCLYRACSETHLALHTAIAHEGSVLPWYLCKNIAPPVVQPLSLGDYLGAGSARRRCGAKMSSLDIVQSLQTKQLMLDLLTTSKLPKTLAAFSRQLEPVKIIHFFKCMESLCDYSTDDSDLFLAHLAVHPERTFSCSYCSKLIVSESSLVKHMHCQGQQQIFEETC
ncbi:conserved hypothetical protein [Ixodes scapularis]|uniref:C2H2-type domain-containing protein n=1 Tax=Ixodes scapularis TaxID=6945 RepID=B7P757_IXOSC|nr:conserved hypothetical protein [Ixodes scapularis]|eukprot:XP_002409580.1 conserved hypothetical protein [Ixodes scapularis]